MDTSIARTPPALDRASPLLRTSGLGVAVLLVSATCFGLAAVFAKEAFGTGVNVASLLATRFGLAAVVFWGIVAWRRPAWPTPRVLAVCCGLGALGYSLQSACYFTALTRMNASLVAQLLYAYPVLVLVFALLLRRETITRRKLAALACSAVGLAVLLRAGGQSGSLTTAGTLLALGAALTYALYIMVAHSLPPTLDVFLIAAIVCSTATISTSAYAVGSGSLHAPSAMGWLWIFLLALVSTVVAAGCFLIGLRMVGPSTAAIVSCLEPVVTAATAVLVYSERLTLSEVVGAALVLGAVILLRWRSPRERRSTLAAWRK